MNFKSIMGREPDTKSHTFYDSVYVKYPEVSCRDKIPDGQEQLGGGEWVPGFRLG